MVKRVFINKVIETLKEEVKDYDVPVVKLMQVQNDNPFRILVATILSARTNDSTTAEVCERLFQKIHRAEDFQKLSPEKIAELIYPVGFYKNKAQYLKQLPVVLQDKFGGIIPQTVEELTELPGVGRKTANLVVALAFDKPAICVDIHVHRIINRLGYLQTKTPLETEMQLRKKLARKHWISINTIFVAFGQNLCRPISPHCSICPIKKYCHQVGVEQQR